MEWVWRSPAEVATRILATLFAEPPVTAGINATAAGGDGRLRPRTFPLAPFQEEAVKRARPIIARRGGVIVADSVGLGKTYIALALIEEALRTGGDVAVIVPAALRPAWSPLLRRLGRSTTDAREGREPGRARLISHTRLSLGTHGPERLYDSSLVVIDEAHAFRTPATRRYRSLLELAPHAGVVLLTATPINNRLGDLHHLLALFAADDAFRDVGAPSLAECFRAADRVDSPDDAAMAAVRRITAEVVIRRTRALVATEATWAGSAAHLRFPRRAPPRVIRYDAPALGSAASLIASLELPAFIGSGSTGESGAVGVGALVRIGLLKRLESGTAALRRSASRQLALARAFADAAARGLLLRPRDSSLVGGAGGPEADVLQLLMDEIIADRAPPGMDLDALAAAAARDVARLRRLLKLTAGADAKLTTLDEALRRLPPGEKVLLFTEFRDTAEAVWRALAPGGGVARIDGGGAWLGLHRAGRGAVIRRFAPLANGGRPPPAREAVRLLVSTDVLAEGLNLQDARHVISYDLPWNPVRLLQRIGRVDRLGSRHAEVVPWLAVPGAGLEELLRLMERLRTKLGRIAATLGGEDVDAILARLVEEHGGGVPAGEGPGAVGGAGAGVGSAGRGLLSHAESANPADPMESLRALYHRLLDGADGAPASRAQRPGRASVVPLGACVAIPMTDQPLPAALVLLHRAGRGWLMEVGRDRRVTEAGAASAPILEAALAGAGECSGEDGAGRDCRALRDFAASAIRHLERVLAGDDAPSLAAAGTPTAGLARVLRRALMRAGPAPPQDLVRRVDEALEGLLAPLPPRLLSRAAAAINPLGEADDLETLLTAADAIRELRSTRLPNGVRRRTPDRSIRTVAVLRIRVCPQPLAAVDDGSVEG